VVAGLVVVQDESGANAPAFDWHTTVLVCIAEQLQAVGVPAFQS